MLVIRTIRRPLAVLLLIAMLASAVLAGCGRSGRTETGSVNPDAKHPIVTIEMDSGKSIRLELYPEVAPNTVNNFISLAQEGFYDGLTFHRVIDGFMIQGGDPAGNGTGGPGYEIRGEFTGNGVPNSLLHKRGVLSMARRDDSNDSAGSQFFIMVADTPSLDGGYAAFGRVVEGMETVDEIAALPTAGDRPETPPVMKKVTVDLNGAKIKEPDIIKP